jgi:hypothetical protein
MGQSITTYPTNTHRDLSTVLIDMRTKKIRQKGLSFSVKIKKLDGKVISRRSSIKMKVFNFLKAGGNEFKWIYLCVTYKPGIYNEGKYYPKDKHEILNAWQSFTEEDLIMEALTY